MPVMVHLARKLLHEFGASPRLPWLVCVAGLLAAGGYTRAPLQAQDAPPPATDVTVEGEAADVAAPAENAEVERDPQDRAEAAPEPGAEGPDGASAERVITRFEAEIELRRLIAAGQHAEAAKIGEQWVPLTEAEFGPQSLEAAEAYATLAAVQSKLGDYTTAENNYLHALSVYREVAGSFTEALIEPLLGLGDNYQSSGQYTNAVAAYNEARTVSRRVYGLQNEGQVEMLDRLTETHDRMNQPIEAHERQLEALQLVTRNHGASSPETLEAIYKYALWLRGAHRYTEEREQYFRAERLIIENYGENSVMLVRPLRERAISFRVQAAATPQGIGGLRDALAILEAEANPDPLMLAEVLRDIGDWDVAFNRIGTEGTEYLRSWALLGNVPNGEELRESWYGGIETVLSAPLSPRSLSNDPSAPRGHVLVRFDIDAFGRSANVTVVASDPPGLKDEAVARHIRESRFRPNIVDGELVTTRNRALDVVFRYAPDAPDSAN
jgi:tetratricopeptide (TPR) repeat protein